MKNYTTDINTTYNIPNITVYNKYCDGVHYGYRVVPNEGYVMYDSTEQATEIAVDEYGNPIMDENGNYIEVPTTYYCRRAELPLSNPNRPYDFIAVLESDVPSDHIFGGGNNNHEIM